MTDITRRQLLVGVALTTAAPDAARQHAQDTPPIRPARLRAWRGRERCARAREDEELCSTIRAIHESSRGTYEVPRVHAELVARGCRVRPLRKDWRRTLNR